MLPLSSATGRDTVKDKLLREVLRDQNKERLMMNKRERERDKRGRALFFISLSLSASKTTN